MKPRACVAIMALILSCGIPAQAEVSLRLTSEGWFSSLYVEPDPRAGIWTRFSDLPDNQILNPHGDILRDHVPTCSVIALPLDDPAQLRHGLSRDGWNREPDARRLLSALVVWSRFDGKDRELVYSLWDARRKAWTEPALVDPVDNQVDDVEPRLQVSEQGPELLWVRGNGQERRKLMMSLGKVVVVNSHYRVRWGVPFEVGTDRATVAAPEVPSDGEI